MKQAFESGAVTALTLTFPSRIFSRAGVELDPRLDIWEWADGPSKFRIDFTRYSNGHERLVQSLKQALIPFYKGSSGHHVVNLEGSYRYFADQTGPFSEPEVSVMRLSNFVAKVGSAGQGRVGTLNGLIQKWVALGLPGMQPACASYLSERKKPGNKKGEAVTTRNPVAGPFTELEYKSLYSAINAAYGRGDFPIWALVLFRLLMACGGRISQYASLKVSDFNSITRVLKLPQAKTREDHSRRQFLEFAISPQTSRLIEDYILDLKSMGHGADSPLFPERLATDSQSEQSRIVGDIFFGHCTPSQLSRRFQNEVAPIAPPAPRLDFAPMPITPKRFRYTFGTRMAEEGASKVVIANRLGHADLQNVEVYFSASPKIVENIDAAMAPLLAPLARAFQGNLVENEASSTQKGAPGSRIIDFRVSVDPVGGCVSCARGCAFNKPVSCYTCFRFEPFLDAPHEEVLQRLLKEREKRAGDDRMAAINDESIRAVEEVIALCHQVRQQRASKAGVVT